MQRLLIIEGAKERPPFAYLGPASGGMKPTFLNFRPPGELVTESSTFQLSEILKSENYGLLQFSTVKGKRTLIFSG